jgi:hypothetical protein
MNDPKVAGVAKNYYCKICDYNTCKRSNYMKHLQTSKHLKLTYTDPKIAITIKDHICLCGKAYKHKQSLYNHKKICSFISNNEQTKNIQTTTLENKEISNNDNLVYSQLENLVVKLITENNEIKNTLLKENQELRQQITELIPKVGNNNNNTINNKVNINVFLNEKCKDAMSINEFVDNIEISLKNLLTTKSKGLCIGLNEIIIENMNKLSIYERPIHCTDKKRETLYIKNDTWEKDSDRTHTNSMLKALQSQQFKAMKKWIQEHPNYMESEELKVEYMTLVNKCTSSLNEHEKKLLKNICESTYIKDEDTFIE